MRVTYPCERRSMITVYEAVFKASESNLNAARWFFIQQFGEEPYNTYIRPYVERLGPRYLFGAPTTIYKYWMIDRLARIMAAQRGEEYIPPPEFVAVDLPDDPIFPCAACGELTSERFSRPGDKYGIEGRLCDVCDALFLRKMTEDTLREIELSVGSRLKRIKEPS